MSADSWIQLASSVCNLIVEASASDKLTNHSNVRALHSAGVFDALCRLLAALMRRQRSSGGDRVRGGDRADRSDRSDSDREYSSSGGGDAHKLTVGCASFPFCTRPTRRNSSWHYTRWCLGSDHQRSFLQVKARCSRQGTNLLVYPLVRELTRAWVTSWLGATVPDVSPDGEDGYIRFCRAWADGIRKRLGPRGRATRSGSRSRG